MQQVTSSLTEKEFDAFSVLAENAQLSTYATVKACIRAELIRQGLLEDERKLPDIRLRRLREKARESQ